MKCGENLFITFEGSDGSGKSTILEKVCETFEKEGRDFIVTREPGGPPLSEKIRKLLLDPENKEMTAKTECLLYAASRAQHVDERIRPALEEGKIVLSDRFVLSSLAYQGYGRKLGVEEVLEVNRFATGDLSPDLILFFSIDPMVAIQRKRENFESDRLEKETNDFHQRVYQGYEAIMERYKEDSSFQVVDASGSVEEVYENAITIIKTFLGEIE